MNVKVFTGDNPTPVTAVDIEQPGEAFKAAKGAVLDHADRVAVITSAEGMRWQVDAAGHFVELASVSDQEKELADLRGAQVNLIPLKPDLLKDPKIRKVFSIFKQAGEQGKFILATAINKKTKVAVPVICVTGDTDAFVPIAELWKPGQALEYDWPETTPDDDDPNKQNPGTSFLK